MEKHNCDDYTTFEEKRTYQILYFFGIICTITLFIVSFINHTEGERFFSYLSASIGILVIFSLIHLRYKKNKNLNISLYGIIVILLTWNLITTGGVDGNGILWIFIFPPFIFFIQGVKKGSITLSIVFLIIITIFYFPDFPLKEYEFDPKFKIRFMITLTTESLIAFFAEYSRYKLLKEVCFLSSNFKKLSKTDDLTQIFNRRHGMEYLKHIRDISDRSETPFSLIIFDIDHFKSVNDTYGHSVGDEILCELTERVRTSIRSQDILCRWGGEEFLLVLPQTDISHLGGIAEKLRALINSTPFLEASLSLTISCSFGCAQGMPGENLDDLIGRADQSLYAAKNSGRNRVSVDMPEGS